MKKHEGQRGSIAVDGTVLRYRVEGVGIPAIVLGSSTYYPRTFSVQLRQFCRLAFADLRHFAPQYATFDTEMVSFATYVDDIERIRQTLEFERIVIIGHSKHGNLGLEYAIRYPARVSHVVMIGSPPVNVKRTVEAREEYWASHASEQRKLALARNWDSLKPETLAAMPSDAALVARYVADGPRYWHDPHYDASSLWRNVYVNMPVMDKLHTLFAEYELPVDSTQADIPVLVIMGRADYIVPHVLWQSVLPKFPNATFQLLEQSGHTPQLEEPNLFDQALCAWLCCRPAAY